MPPAYKALATAPTKSPKPTGDTPNGVRKNRQRVLMLSSRGTTHRHRHLLNDLHSLLPHSRKDAKLDTKTQLSQLNELAEMYNCNNVLFFEARKGKDLYLWLGKCPNGPTVKMFVQNLHTMEELNFTGNCLKGSRPILSFDATFDAHPHLRLIKEMFTQAFGVPKGARKSKPFVDHVMGFTIADNKIWIRVYQIAESEVSRKKRRSDSVAEEGDDDDDDDDEDINRSSKDQSKGSKDTRNVSLVEIGPRFILTPIVVQESAFGGAIIYENKQFVSPNAIRSALRKRSANKYASRSESQVERQIRRGELGLNTKGGKKREKSELDDSVLFR